jgi:O-succinylbenzoic acid--CoA ligase
MQRSWLLQRADQTAGATALESEGDAWTFATLADRARRASAYVVAAAPPPDAPVALLMSGGAEFAAWFHAVALAGRAVLPLNTRLTTDEIHAQLADAGVALLVGESGDGRLDALAGRAPAMQLRAAPSLSMLPRPTGPLPGETFDIEAPLVVLFTSGTTGRAKGACLSWKNFEASANAAMDTLGPAVAGRWLACMPLFHVGGLSILIRSVLFGGPVRLQRRFDAAAVSDALDAEDVAGVSLVPTMLSRLLDHRAGRRAPASLRVLLLGGAAAAPELVGRALEAGYPVCPTYGLTEATSQVATAPPPRQGSRAPSAMRALPGVEIRIVAGDRELPPETAGEITVRGPNVMRGYLNDLPATARALRGGWLWTGDIGYLDSDGALHVLDRRDDLIVSGGENVYPAEIEAVLHEHPGVSEVGVAGVPDRDLGARVAAWVVKKAGAAVDAAALEHFCRSRLAGYKRPREFRFVDILPRTTGGKLQRRSLVDIK